MEKATRFPPHDFRAYCSVGIAAKIDEYVSKMLFLLFPPYEDFGHIIYIVNIFDLRKILQASRVGKATRFPPHNFRAYCSVGIAAKIDEYVSKMLFLLFPPYEDFGHIIYIVNIFDLHKIL